MQQASIIIAVAIVLAIAGFFGAREYTGQQTNQPQEVETAGAETRQTTEEESTSGNDESHNLAPDFQLEALDGSTVHLADYRGKKAVVLDFWATWCPDCARNMPRLNTLYEQYHDQVEVIAVNLQEPKDKVASYVDERDLSFPVVLDPNSEVTQAYGVPGTNYHVLIDRNGNLVRVVPGDIQESDIAKLIES